MHPGGDVCPGTNVTFTCSVSFLVLRWEYNGDDEITGGGGVPDPIGPFALEIVEANATFISSTATVTATGALDGTVITCTNPLTMESQDGTVNVTSKLYAM